MLAFIYLADSMMALLVKSVPAFDDTWMATEDENLRDRGVWSRVARY
jgi:hypothetical protein